MLRVVLDTNIVVSAFLSPQGIPAHIFRALHQEAFTVVISEPILTEYQRALGYERVQRLHGLSSQQITETLDRLRAFAVLVEPASTPTVVKADPDDDKFFACAIAGEAGIIVSGDKRVQQVGTYQGIRVLSPETFWALLRRE